MHRTVYASPCIRMCLRAVGVQTSDIWEIGVCVCGAGLTRVPESVYWIHDYMSSCSLWLRLGRNFEAPPTGKSALTRLQLHSVTPPISVCGCAFWSLFVCSSCLPSFFPRAKTRPGSGWERESERLREIKAVAEKEEKKSQKIWNAVPRERDETIKSRERSAREKGKIRRWNTVLWGRRDKERAEWKNWQK